MDFKITQKLDKNLNFKIIGYKTQQSVGFRPQSAGFTPAKCGDCPIKIWPQSAKTQSAGEQSAGFMVFVFT